MGVIPYPSFTYLGAPTNTAMSQLFGHGVGERQISHTLAYTNTVQISTLPTSAPSTSSIPLRNALASTLTRFQQSSSTIPMSNHIPSTRVSATTSTPTSSSTSQHSSNNAFSMIALAGILAAVAFLLISVFILGFMLRRHKLKAHWKRIEESTRSKPSPNMSDSTTHGIGMGAKDNIAERKENGMGRIFVTREIESRHSMLREEDGWEKHVNFEVIGGKF